MLYGLILAACVDYKSRTLAAFRDQNRVQKSQRVITVYKDVHLACRYERYFPIYRVTSSGVGQTAVTMCRFMLPIIW